VKSQRLFVAIGRLDPEMGIIREVKTDYPSNTGAKRFTGESGVRKIATARSSQAGRAQTRTRST